MRNAWSEVFDDMEKELAGKDLEIKKLEKRALCAERQRDEALDKLTALRRRFEKQSLEFEETLGKNKKLKAQVNRDFENSSTPSSGKENHKKISNSREKTGRSPGGHFGHKGIKGTPVEDYQFTLVHDHDKTFLSYGGEHQECLAHVLRYLKDSIDNEPERSWNTEMYDFIKRMIHEVKQMGRDVPEDKCAGYEKEFDRILDAAQVEYEEDPPSDYYKDGYNLQKRLREYRDLQLLFLRHPEFEWRGMVVLKYNDSLNNNRIYIFIFFCFKYL